MLSDNRGVLIFWIGTSQSDLIGHSNIWSIVKISREKVLSINFFFCYSYLCSWHFKCIKFNYKPVTLVKMRIRIIYYPHTQGSIDNN